MLWLITMTFIRSAAIFNQLCVHAALFEMKLGLSSELSCQSLREPALYTHIHKSLTWSPFFGKLRQFQSQWRRLIIMSEWRAAQTAGRKQGSYLDRWMSVCSQFVANAAVCLSDGDLMAKSASHTCVLIRLWGSSLRNIPLVAPDSTWGLLTPHFLSAYSECSQENSSFGEFAWKNPDGLQVSQKSDIWCVILFHTTLPSITSR